MTHRMVLVSFISLFYHRPLTLKQILERRRCFGNVVVSVDKCGSFATEGKQMIECDMLARSMDTLRPCRKFAGVLT